MEKDSEYFSREYFRQMGRKGAKKQSAEMTPLERKRRARLAAKARWALHGKKKEGRK